MVIDPDASRRAFRRRDRQLWLERVAGAVASPATFVAAYVARDKVLRPSGAFLKTPFGTFSDSLMAEARARGWTVVSMKDDWKRVFPFEAP